MSSCKPVIIVATVMTIICLSGCVFADNQIIPGNIGTADPAPMVDGDTLYLYTTTDAIGNGDLSIYDIRCWSTTDLYHWEDRGVALNENDVPWAAKIGNLWAPHCIKLGGKYHLYFPANDGRVFHLGHAVADHPTGPFTADDRFMNGCGNDAIDPFAILDSGDGGTGKAYIAWNQVGTTPNRVYLAQLNEAYDDVTGTVHDISAGLGSPTRYKEGIWLVREKNTWYCFIADWTGAVESISYSTASSITGPYTRQHDILNQNTNSSTIHAGVVRFQDKWIMFYHTGGNEFGGTINSGTKRVVGIEYLQIDSSGASWSFPAIPKTLRGVGIPNSFDTIQIDRHSPGGIDRAGISVVKGDESRGWMVSGIGNGGYVKYDDVDFTMTDKSSGEISLRVAAAETGGSVAVREGSGSGVLLGTVDVPSTGGLTAWKTVTASLTDDGLALTGIHDVVLVFKTTVSNQYNVNWVSIGNRAATTAMSGPSFLPTAGESSKIMKVNGLSGSAVNGHMGIVNLRGQMIPRLSGGAPGTLTNFHGSHHAPQLLIVKRCSH